MLGLPINRKGAIAGAVSAAVLGAALVPALAFAQTPEATGEASATTEQATDEAKDCAPRLAFRLDALEEVATALGVTTDELREAMQSVRAALKPEERPSEPPTAEEIEAKRAEFQTALATELGVSVADLEAAFEAAKPTDEEIEAFRAERLADAEARLADAVEAGRLTQDQADAILERLGSGEGPVGPGRHHRGLRGFGSGDAGARGAFSGILGGAPLGDPS